MDTSEYTNSNQRKNWTILIKLNFQIGNYMKQRDCISLFASFMDISHIKWRI